MSALNSEQLPILAGALLRLRGLTLAAVFDATGIVQPTFPLLG